MIAKVNTPVIHPNFAPPITESGRPVCLQYIQTAINPAPMDQRTNRRLAKGTKSSRIDNAAAAKAIRSAAGLENEIPESTTLGIAGGARMTRGASITGSGSPEVGLPHLWQKREPSTNWVPQVQ